MKIATKNKLDFNYSISDKIPPLILYSKTTHHIENINKFSFEARDFNDSTLYQGNEKININKIENNRIYTKIDPLGENVLKLKNKNISLNSLYISVWKIKYKNIFYLLTKGIIAGLDENDNNILYVYGYEKNNKNNILYQYNLENNDFKLIKIFSNNKFTFSMGGIIKNKLYIIGGRKINYPIVFNSVIIYDIKIM